MKIKKIKLDPNDSTKVRFSVVNDNGEEIASFATEEDAQKYINKRRTPKP